MRLDWFLPRRLAKRFVEGGVSNKEVAHLMLTNLVFGAVLFYGAFTSANPPWTLLSLVEFVSVLIVTLIGFTKVYDAAGGDKNPSFAALFNCLSFGTWFWSTFIVWLAYWLVLFAFHFGVISAYRFEHLAIAQNLETIGGSFEWLLTFMAVVLWEVLYFSWLARVIPRAR